MKKTLLIFICTTFTSFFSLEGLSQERSQEKFFCALPRAAQFKDMVLEMKGSDKTRHCSIMCIVALECNRYETYLLGLAKELYDALGFGTPDAADIEANKKGIALATSGRALSEYDCLDQCLEIYSAH